MSRDSAEHHRSWHSCVFSESQQLYGHLARVWQAKLLTDGIVSISEVRMYEF